MIVFTWSELPEYGAKLLGNLRKTGIDFKIIATRPKVPVSDLENLVGSKIYWIEPNSPVDIISLIGSMPSIFFQAGWYVPAFVNIGDQVRKSRGKIILLSDNSYKLNLRQILGAIYFRLFMRNKFDLYWVPGKSGKKFMNFLGINNDRVFLNLYASDEKIFNHHLDNNIRKRRLIFAGRLIKEKGILDLIYAFNKIQNKIPSWTLTIYGNGPLYQEIKSNKNIECLPYITPEELSIVLRNSMIFCLPSYSDHWPLVINEAALSGCALIVSDKVGNIPEFTNSINSRIIKAGNIDEISLAILSMVSQCEEDFALISTESLCLAKSHGLDSFVNEFQSIISKIGATS